LLTSSGVAAGAIIASRGGAALAGPAPRGGPFVKRAQEDVTLELWAQHPEELAPFKAIVGEFSAANPGIEINVTMTPTDQYRAKIQTALNTGTGPDLYQVFARPEFDTYVSTGNLLDITDSVDVSQLEEVGREAVTVNDRVWAVPTGSYTVGICYHVDLFEEAGVAAEPTTWAEMRAVMEQLKAADIVPYSIAAKDGSLTYFNYIGLASSVLGLDGFNQVLAGERKLTDPDLVTVIAEMRAWVPYYQPNFLGTPYAESKALFATKRTAMMDCGSADLSGYYDIDPEAQLGFFYWPTPEAGMPQVTNTGMNITLGINPKTSKADGAIAFLQWVATPEGATSFTNHNKVLPVVQGVEPAGDPILTEMVNTPLDVPVWYERWPTLKIGEVWTEEGNFAFDEGNPPEEMAAKLQASVDEQMANPPA
jgi:raffinose/stachyose/melibiose transport system substrate-binding protein